MRISRLVSLCLVMLISMLVLPLATTAQGNSAAAHACKQGGWAGVEGSNGEVFANEGQCVGYVARGGTLQPTSPPVSIATVTIQSVTYYTATQQITVDFIATGFASSSPLQDYIVIYTADPDYPNSDLAETFSFETDTNGTFDSSWGLQAVPCIDGAEGSVTITDSTGRSATGVFTVTCP